MATLLNDHIDHDADAPAIVDDGVTLSWRQLGERVNRWVDLLTSQGLGSGDRLACVLGNRRETLEVLLACLHTGVTVVPVNWHLTEPEISYILSDSGSRALVTEQAFAVAAGAAARSATDCALRLVLGGEDLEGCQAVEPLLAAASPAEPADQRCGSTMLYTSGTTGAPKGVVNGLFVVDAPFSRVAKLARYARVVLGVPARGRVLLDGPWYHSSQLFFALLALLQGSVLVIRPSFDPVVTLRIIDQEQITATHLVPTQFIRLLRVDPAVRAAFSGASLSRVWHGGGPCPAEVKREMIQWWGPILVEYYGATEGGVVTLIGSEDWLRRPGSVGQAVPPCQIVIVGDDGVPVPVGEPGRIFVRRRAGERFRYHNAPDKTRSAYLGSDTFTYGEVGYLDEAGFLYLTGRAQDLIVSGGVNVYPAEVEAVLLDHPAVRDAAVIGVADDEFGERVVGIVVAEPGAPAELAAELTRHCRRSLAGFKAPRAYHFVDKLPREATGKIRKEPLREAYSALLTSPAGPSPAAGPFSDRSSPIDRAPR